MTVGRLRVLTMNIYGPANPDWERRHRLTAATLESLAPDVLALQEAPTGDADLLDRIVGADYYMTPFAHASEDGVGGVVATRWTHDVVTEIDLRITARARDALPWTAATIVELDTPVGRVVVAHHKPSWPFPFEYERERQAVMVVRALEEHIGD